MKRLPLILILAACLIVFKAFWPASQHAPSAMHASQAAAPHIPSTAAPTEQGSDSIAAASLPQEAQQTLAAIRQGGPFAYERDGVVFGNFEKRLPFEPRGYYHEYTVKTPGARNRGARRIIAGGNPPRVFFYTDDHYQSFRRIQE